MNKWELMRYVLDAKKTIDTLLYLSEYGKKLSICLLYTSDAADE